MQRILVIPGIALVALLMAACQTARVEKPVVTDVALPEARPYVMSSAVVETPEPPLQAPAPSQPAPVELPRLTPPASGWMPLEIWTAAYGLGRPQKIAAGHYAVSTRAGVLQIQLGNQMARWDGTCVWLGFAPKLIGGQPYLHWIDFQRTLEPLLHRPSPLLKPGRVVVLDAGHGGGDSGTCGPKGQYEKDFALDWARRVEPLLRTNGWQVFLTRTADIDLSLPSRLALADQVQADLFISLHFNGLSAAAQHGGVETFTIPPVGMPSTVTRTFEDNLRLDFPNNAHDRENLQYAFRLHREVLAATRAADGGIRRARFMAVLRGQRRPAVLIEGGFLSNADEVRRIATPAYRQKLAEAVARALQ